MLGLAGTASAQQLLALEQGPTELQPCLDQAGCRAVLEPLATESLVALGWFLQHDSLGGTALTGRGTGVTIAVQGDTPDLGRRNLITEELALPPMLPKLEVGYQLGSYTFDDPFPQIAVSAFVFPPLSLDGYRLLQTGATLSGAVPVVEHYLWLGAELQGTYSTVSGEMLGDGSVLEDVDAVNAFVEIETPACASLAAGCNDRIRNLVLTGRVGVAVDPIPEVFVYLKGAVSTLQTQLDIAYDASRWGVRGVQPAVSYGLGGRIEDRVTLVFGGVTGPRNERFRTSDARTFTRLNAGIVVRTGDRRYWYEDETVTPPP